MDLNINTIQKQKIKIFIAESSTPMPVQVEDTSHETEKNVTFADDIEQNALLYAVPFRDSTYERQIQTGDELADFFKRPVEIYAFTWDVGIPYTNLAIFPWQLYMSDTAVLAKLDTFKLVHATLKIKILVNGTPFHYGRIFVGVYPSEYTNNTSALLPDTTTLVTNYRNEYNTGTMNYQANRTMFSSRPHVLINPGKNDPALISWPFFAATDWADVISRNDWARLGQLEIWELNPLAHSNGGNTEVRVSFIAWLEDVEVAGITTALPGQSSKYYRMRQRAKQIKKLTPIPEEPPPKVEEVVEKPPFNPESSKPKKTKGANKSKSKTPTKRMPVSKPTEYGQNGAVSAPMSALASAAGYFTEIPVIGKFAKATEIGASAMGRIASIFGFSKPVVLDKHCFMVQSYYSDLASTSGTDNILKLSVDPKQEITVDPSTVGLRSDDELAFMNIAKREALIHSFEWVVDSSTAGNPFGHLWACRVHPLIAPRFSSSQCLTPVGFIAYPFQHWTGALRFRVQVVCSQMHSGRLLIAYNPDKSNSVGVTADMNTRFCHIMDISEETDVTFEINWAQAEAFREVDLDFANNDSVILGPISVMTGNDNFRCNGRLDIYVLNRLSAPTPANAYVNVWMSAGDSFKVNNPRTIGRSSWSAAGGNFPLPIYEPESSKYFYAEASNVTRVELTDQENAPAQNTHYVLNGDYDDGVNDLNEVYFGETIVSIRTMLKRYNVHSVLPFVLNFTSGDLVSASSTRTIFPSGRSAGQYGSSLTDNATNGSLMTYLRYYCQGYIGFRGSIRWKTMCLKDDLDTSKHYILRIMNRIANQVIVYVDLGNAADTAATLAQTYQNSGNVSGAAAGITQNPLHMGPGALAEIPFQQPLRYAEIHETTNADVRYSGMYAGFRVGMNTFQTGATEYVPLELLCAGGEDATFFFFVGVPPIIPSL